MFNTWLYKNEMSFITAQMIQISHEAN